MSLAEAAKQVQTMGRGNDSMLIHMSPREIAGLQAIAEHHGGTLTLNPHTGLPEAGFLEDILPMIAGIALNAFVPGLGAVASGLLVGGATAAVTGDLEKGLMAGLGAFGGAGVAGGLAKMGAAGATEAAGIGAKAGLNALDDAAVAAARGGSDISQSLANSYSQAAAQGTAQSAAAAQAANQGAAQAGAIQAANQGVRQGAQQMAGQAQAGLPAAAARPPMPPTQGITPGMAQGSLDRLKMMGQGVQNLGKPGTAEALSDMAMPIGAAMLPMLQGQQAKGAPPEEEYEPTNPFIKKRLSPNFNGFVPQRPQPYYIPTGLGYARGGIARARHMANSDAEQMQNFAPAGMQYGEGLMHDTDMSTAGLNADEAAQQKVADAFSGARLQAAKMPKHMPIAMAGGGLSAGLNMRQGSYGGLGGYSDGGRLLKGPGDGMSDDIPAHVDGEQPVRLTDGEFVVSADVVSGLGNGSTEAGARKLYGMMDRVRHARTGKKKQAPAIKSDKFLPA